MEKNFSQASKQKIKNYQKRINSILYTTIIIKLDITFATFNLSRFFINPSLKHLKATNKIIKYLYAIKYLNIAYENEPKEIQALLITKDTSFTNNKETKRSS